MNMNNDILKAEMMAKQINAGQEVLFEDDRTLEDIIQEIADQEGMTFEQTMKLFKQGLKANFGKAKTKSPKEKAKAKTKKKQAKASRKRNR